MSDNPPISTAPSLPPGWTEHTAPTGHIYFYNTQTKESTCRRPAPPPPSPSLPHDPQPQQLSQLPPPHLRLSDPRVANAFLAKNATQNNEGNRWGADRGHDFGRSRSDQKPRRQPVDKPKSKIPIPGCEPWVLVFTKYGRRFVYNPAKNASYWRIPDKLKPAILELDRARIRKKMQEETGEPITRDTGNIATDTDTEYEVVEEIEEVEEDEEGEQEKDDDGNPSKRQKTEEAFDEAPLEFSEADIAFQLQAAAEEYGELDTQEDWGGEQENDEWAEQDAPAVFMSLLDDFSINPYSSWEKLVEEGKIIDDPRYTALPTTKARKAAWEEWSRAKIKETKEKRAHEEKKDPRAAYMLLLQKYATPKLYWPEFKRKYRKEAAMKDLSLPEKNKEKWYREYVGRLKLPQSTLKSDLIQLLQSIPSSNPGEPECASHLPPQVTTDLRYLTLDPKVRDPLVDAYLQTSGSK